MLFIGMVGGDGHSFIKNYFDLGISISTILFD